MTGDQRVVLRGERVAVRCGPGDGEHAWIAVQWADAEAIVFDDVARVLLAQHQNEIIALVAIEVATQLLLDAPAGRHEALGVGRVSRQDRIVDRRDPQLLCGGGQDDEQQWGQQQAQVHGLPWRESGARA
ncbi:hypothetical protein D3C71_1254000 [compost metagenome]